MTSRAALSRRVLCAAALFGLAAACVAACGGAAASGAGQAAHTFIDLVSEVPLNIDETATPDTASTQLLPTWSSELVRPAPAAPGPAARLPGDDAVVPYLATSWQRAANGSYTFELRRGVRGVSGDPFTAEDVKWSLERAVARSPVAPFLFELAHIDTADPVTILGRYLVRVNVASPSPFTLSVLASYDLAIYDSALYRSHATAGDPWAQQWGATHSASFGAYWVAGFQPGREIVLEANPGFWRRPYYTRVLIRQVLYPSTRLADVLDGSADHTSNLSWQEYQEAVNIGASNGVSATILQTGPGVIAWHLNVSKGPLANQQVREALNLGVDRLDLADGIDDSFDAPSALTIPAAFGGAQPADFNGEEARSLLLAAGYSPGKLTINVFLNGDELGGVAPELLGFLYHDMLNIGVNLDMTYIADPDELYSLEQHSAVESTIDADTPLLGGAGFMLEETTNAKLDPASPAAEEGYANPTLQGLLDQLASSPGGTSTAALIQEAAQIIDSDVPTINFAAIPVQNVTRSNITGYAAYTDPVTYYENLHPTG